MKDAKKDAPKGGKAQKTKPLTRDVKKPAKPVKMLKTSARGR